MEKIKFPSLDKKNFDAYASEKLEEIKKDKEFYKIVKSLGTEEKPITIKEVKDNIVRIMDLREDLNYCKNCPGFDKCAKSTPHYKMGLRFDGVLLEKYFEICDIGDEKLSVFNRIVYDDFEGDYSNYSINNIVIDKTRDKARERFKCLAQKTKIGAYIYGSYGVGKTYISLAFLRSYLDFDKTKTVAFIDASSRFKKLSDSDRSYNQNDKDNFEKTMDKLGSVDLLVIDGFGNELKNDVVRDRVLLPLFTERYRKKLPTIITSNYTIEEISEMYSFTSRRSAIHPSAKRLYDILKVICGDEIEILTDSKLFN